MTRPIRSRAATVTVTVAALAFSGCGIRATSVVDAGRPAGGVWVYFVNGATVTPVVRLGAPPADPRAALILLLIGPSSSEEASGFRTSLPAEAGLTGVTGDSAGLTITLTVDPRSLSSVAQQQLSCTATAALPHPAQGSGTPVGVAGPAGPPVTAPPCLASTTSARPEETSRPGAYADPEAARRNFGPRFNAGVSGEVSLQMAATDPDCAGILVNSAVREISLVISASTAQSLLTPAAAAAPAQRSWWKRRQRS